MNNSQPVTPAQELITCAMLATLTVCFAANYILINTLNINSIGGYLTLAVGTFITAGYLAPNLAAHWLGRPLDEIMHDTTTFESSLDITDIQK